MLQSQGHLHGEQVARHSASQYRSSAFTYSYSPGRQSLTLQSDFHAPRPFHKLKSSSQELLLNKKMQRFSFFFLVCNFVFQVEKEEIGKMQHSYLAICYSLWFHILSPEHHRGLTTDRGSPSDTDNWYPTLKAPGWVSPENLRSKCDSVLQFECCATRWKWTFLR